jgi:single-stranded DNA-binding protein
MNVSNQIGRLTKSIELRKTKDGKDYCYFQLAVPNLFKKGEAHFLNYMAWGKRAQICSNNLKRGQQVGFTSSVITRNKANTNDAVMVLLVNEITFVGYKNDTRTGPEEKDVNLDLVKQFAGLDEEMPD